nr:gliding motility-associated C-terminal domain-containing protein [Marinigracilibium pacificum]
MKSINFNFSKATINIFLIFSQFLIINAQVSDNGLFEADYISGCAPLTVTITTLGAEADGFIYEYQGDVVGFVEDKTYEYTEPGEYTIAYVKNDGSNTILDFLNIKILASGSAPQFDIYTCKNNEILVDLSKDQNFDIFEINYGDNSGPPDEISNPILTSRHIYTVTGPFNVSVKGSNSSNADAGNCVTANQQVMPISGSLTRADISQITTESVSSGAGSISLDFNLQDNNIYKVFQSTNSSGSFNEIATINGTESNISFANLNTSSNTYCYQINAFDACDNTFEPSATACNLKITGQATNAKNQINWITQTTPLSNLAIYKDGGLFNTVSPATNTGTWNDIDLNCNQDYTYYAETFYNGSDDLGGFVMASNTIQLTALFNQPLPSVSNLIATINQNEEIELTWSTPDPKFDYEITKSTNGSPFVSINRVSAEQYTDEFINLSLNNCYQIRTADDCGNLSENKITICPTALFGEFIQASGEGDLYWSEYLSDEFAVSTYEVEYLDQNLNLLEPIYSGNDLQIIAKPTNPVQTAYFRVKITLSNGSIVYTNAISADLSPAVIHPTAFSPNGDMLNDEITFWGRFISSFDIYLYNRWGELIKELNNNNPTWNGIVKGKEVEQGVYIYILEGKTDNGEPYSQKGSITLIR